MADWKVGDWSDTLLFGTPIRSLIRGETVGYLIYFKIMFTENKVSSYQVYIIIHCRLNMSPVGTIVGGPTQDRDNTIARPLLSPLYTFLSSLIYPLGGLGAWEYNAFEIRIGMEIQFYCPAFVNNFRYFCMLCKTTMRNLQLKNQCHWYWYKRRHTKKKF